MKAELFAQSKPQANPNRPFSGHSGLTLNWVFCQENMSATDSSLYESEKLRAVTGPAIRPGGVDLTARAVEFCSFPAGARLLDVGCGEGATVGFLRDSYRLDSFGVDFSSLLLADGKSRNGSLPLARATAEQLPFADCSLDGVLCECVFSLLPEPEKALREFNRVLSLGGSLIMSDIYLRVPGEGLSVQGGAVDGCLMGAMSVSFLKTMLAESGFSLILWEDHSHLLRELAARLILADGSLEGFWATLNSAACPVGGRTDKFGGRPGYYLLVARKD